MKSLAERKKFRAEQREQQLKESGAPNIDSGVDLGTVDANAEGKAYADMTIDELKDAAKSLGAEVPKEKTVKADIREYVENLAKFKQQEKDEAENGNGSGWKSGQ